MIVINDGVADGLTTDLRMLYTFIRSQSCVLLLGPLFGSDHNNAKIHLALKNRLSGPPYSLQLDDEFDNLYISRSSDGAQNAALITEIISFYGTMQRNPIYDQLLEIGFRAIITYTADHLLYEANQANKEYDFSYFSARGNQPSDENQHSDGKRSQNIVISKKPIIYNIFGSIHDLNSLITDYDSLYDFLINILRADKEFPLQLKNILSNAKAFLFLGFDLSKWYIPLLIRKLNQFILNNGSRAKTSIFAFACLDDTPVAPSPDSLNKYPLLFRPFPTLDSITLINQLYVLPRTPARGDNPPAVLRPPTPTEKDFFRGWQEEMPKYGRSEGLELFFKEYGDLRYGGKLKTEFEILNMNYNETVNQRMSFVISEEKFEITCNNIIKSISHFISQLL